MYDLVLFIKYLNESVCDTDAEEVIAELIENTSLKLQSAPEFVEDKHKLFNSYKYELTSSQFIDYYELVKEWCSERGFNGWLKAYSPSSEEVLTYQAQIFTRVSELSIGNFIDYRKYIRHIDLKPVNSKRIIIDFEHDMQKITCYIITVNEWYKLSFEYTSVEGFVVGDIFHSDFSMYLPIKSPPKVWMASKNDIDSQRQKCFRMHAEAQQWPEEKQEENILKYVHWYRHNAVGTCKPEIFGSCSVFQFCIDSGTIENSDEIENFSHKQVIAGFLKHRYSVFFSPIDTIEEQPFRSNIIEKLIQFIPDSLNCAKIRFSIRYGILMLVSKGTRFTDQFDISGKIYSTMQSLIKSLKHEEELMPLIKTFAILCNKLEQQRFINISSDLQTIFDQEKGRFNEKDVLAEKSKNLLLIRRINITPTRILFQPPELNTSNRVLRKFNPDNFVRVSFRDEDFGPLNLSWEYDQPQNSVSLTLK